MVHGYVWASGQNSYTLLPALQLPSPKVVFVSTSLATIAGQLQGFKRCVAFRWQQSWSSGRFEQTTRTWNEVQALQSESVGAVI